MKRRVLFGLLIIMLVALPLFLACEGEETPTPTPTSTPAPTVSPTPTPEAHWWDKFGEPEYGGQITIRTASLNNLNMDPQIMGGVAHPLFCHDSLFVPFGDWTLDPSVHPNQGELIEPEYYQGWLAESWEQTDPLTVIVHLRKGIKWQNKEPVNGREFTAYDVQYNYDRLLGTGSGFTEANPFYRGMIGNIARATAVDDYTVQFEFKAPGVLTIYQLFFTAPIVAPEWVELGQEGILDWHNAVGTGAFIVTDYINGNSLTVSRNPDYWGYDERHPQNQLPYANEVKVLQIEDKATTIAALRTGKIDMITEFRQSVLSWQEAKNLANTNPEIQQEMVPNAAVSIDLRCDNAPFTDIRVRKALQLAIDIQQIAKTHYGGTVDGMPAGLMAPLNKGWCTPYDEWPTELQMEYSYNPDKARQLLAEAGYPDGFDTNCIVSVTSDTELAEIIKSYFSEIGVEMEIVAMEFGAYRAMTNAGKHEQMVMNDQGSAVLMSPDKVLIMRFSGDPIHNWTRNNDSHYDQLWEQFNAAASLDECKRISIEMDTYALEQHWAVNVCPTAIPVVWQPWLKGYNGERIFPAAIPHIAARWWIDEDLK